MMMTPNARAAMRYAELGLALLPLAPRQKIPQHQGWRDNLVRTAEDARRTWSGRDSWCNVGIATGPASALVVLDVDPRHGGDKSLDELQDRFEPLPETACTFTPSGGRHLYFCTGEALANSCARLGAGLDTRGGGGLAVLPPSTIRRDDGRIGGYVWAQGHALGEFEPAELPGWLARLMRQPVRKVYVPQGPIEKWSHRIEGVLRQVLRSAPGERNSLLYWASCRLGEMVREGSLNETYAVELLRTAAYHAGLGDVESQATIKSGLR